MKHSTSLCFLCDGVEAFPGGAFWLWWVACWASRRPSIPQSGSFLCNQYGTRPSHPSNQLRFTSKESPFARRWHVGSPLSSLLGSVPAPGPTWVAMTLVKTRKDSSINCGDAPLKLFS